MTPVPAIELPPWYRHVPFTICNELLSVDLDVARWLALEEKRRGSRPTTIFRNVREHPCSILLGNPYPRSAVLSALGLQEEDWLEGIRVRLLGDMPEIECVPPPWKELSGLNDIPALWHRPGDAGRYITAGITVSRDPLNGRLNLGVYRIQVVAPMKGRIFFDPRTHAYENWKKSTECGIPLKVAVFLGANPVYILAAAARLKNIHDDYAIVAKLIAEPLILTGEPPVPAQSEYVIYGDVTAELEVEGPFAEFKGYYVDERYSPVLNVHSVFSLSRPIYPIIVTGAESGLTLMALQNEFLLYAHLCGEGHEVRNVRYLLQARAEFVALIESDTPTPEILQAAMAFDTRCKLFICGTSLQQPWDAIATHGFAVHRAPYYRKGQVEGERMGLLLHLPPNGRPVEY